MLTSKQSAFAAHIIAGASPSEAYRLAGYSASKPSTVAHEAQRLLHNPHIAHIIAEGRARAVERAEWTRELAVERLRGVNDRAFDAVAGGELASVATGAFFNSLDRLNALCGIREEDAESEALTAAREILCTIRSVIDEEGNE